MNFPQAITSGFTNYAIFTGRSSRSAYWYWVLLIVLGVLILGVIERAAGLPPLTPYSGGVLCTLWRLATLLPGLAVSVRRLHDIDKSGWWLLLCLIPIIGVIVLIIWHCTKGSNGENRFGPNPLENGQ